MGKYIVEYAEFHKVEVDAGSLRAANEIAAEMDDDVILEKSIENSGMCVWNVREKT